MAEYTCIVCPNSCRITVTNESDGLVITGNGCKRGMEFARNEHTSPARMLTSTVRLTGAKLSRLPVISAGEIPKSKLFECQKALFAAAARAPVRCGDVVVKDICGTGVNIVASRSVKE